MNKNKDSPVKGFSIGSPEWSSCLVKGLKGFSVNVDARKIDFLTRHVRAMLFWNKTSNLTAITEPFEVAVKHVIDSGAAAPYIPYGAKVLDLGTGGGFPGIPLKILVPSISVTLVDASRKKVSFLKQVIRDMGLTSAMAVQARGEELNRDEQHMGMYDVVISRAFSAVDVFVPMALPFLNPGGLIIAMKGRESDEETRLFHTLSFTMPDGKRITSADLDLEVSQYKLPRLDSERSLMLIRLKK
jgi:16S rRNA (guanine527-N7)-methyltransferase